MKTCPLCPRPLRGQQKHCPICREQRRSQKQVGRVRYPAGMHPNSQANLVRGYRPTSVAKRLERARKGGLATAQKKLEQWERDALGFGGEVALEAFRAGYRVGYNRAYQRIRKAAAA